MHSSISQDYQGRAIENIAFDDDLLLKANPETTEVTTYDILQENVTSDFTTTEGSSLYHEFNSTTIPNVTNPVECVSENNMEVSQAVSYNSLYILCGVMLAVLLLACIVLTIVYLKQKKSFRSKYGHYKLSTMRSSEEMLKY